MSERFPSDPVFEREVLPAVKRFINPVIRLADGDPGSGYRRHH
jgi:hypothetical protein